MGTFLAAHLAWRYRILMTHLPTMMNGAVMMVMMVKSRRPRRGAGKSFCNNSRDTRDADDN